MGLIKAGLGAVGSTMRDQWKEFIYCDSMDDNTLVKKGQKQTSAGNKGSDNIISDGSKIAVANGQAMLIVEQGQVVEFSAEPGEFIFDNSSEPSIFQGDLNEGIKNTFETMKRRFTMGGSSGKDQRVYYINTKEIQGNRFGTPNPVPFRIVDRNIGLDIDMSVRANGEYTFRIIDPILFYVNVSGNVENSYRKEDIENTMRMEFLSALQPAFAEISKMGIRYSELPGHTMELSDVMNKILSEKWTSLRGIEIVSVGINSITALKEDEDMIKELQKSAVYRDPSMAGAAMVGAQSDAMRSAAKNPSGAMGGFVGMNMASNAGGNKATDFYAMVNNEEKREESSKEEWTCPNCSTKNTGNFCTNCGTKKPQGGSSVKCGNCGWQSDSSLEVPNYCPECGNPLK